MHLEGEEPEYGPVFVGRIPKCEELLCVPSFKCIHWDGDGFPFRKIATVHLDDSVEFHVPFMEIPLVTLGTLIQYGRKLS